MSVIDILNIIRLWVVCKHSSVFMQEWSTLKPEYQGKSAIVFINGVFMLSTSFSTICLRKYVSFQSNPCWINIIQNCTDNVLSYSEGIESCSYDDVGEASGRCWSDSTEVRVLEEADQLPEEERVHSSFVPSLLEYNPFSLGNFI